MPSLAQVRGLAVLHIRMPLIKCKLVVSTFQGVAMHAILILDRLKWLVNLAASAWAFSVQINKCIEWVEFAIALGPTCGQLLLPSAIYMDTHMHKQTYMSLYMYIDMYIYTYVYIYVCINKSISGLVVVHVTPGSSSPLPVQCIGLPLEKIIECTVCTSSAIYLK